MSRVDFICKCGQKCVRTGEAARRPFVRLCSECEEKAETHEMKPAPQPLPCEAIINEFLNQQPTQGEFKL